MGSEVYEGTLNKEGKLVWNDGAVWIRVNGADDSTQTGISLKSNKGCITDPYPDPAPYTLRRHTTIAL